MHSQDNPPGDADALQPSLFCLLKNSCINQEEDLSEEAFKARLRLFICDLNELLVEMGIEPLAESEWLRVKALPVPEAQP